MGKTRIEWVQNPDGTQGLSWNPVTGCTPISEGCQNCYAKRMANRFRGRFGYPEDKPFQVTLHPEKLNQPLRWKKPKRIFVCSMGDLFHEDIPFEFISAIFGVMAATPQHNYIVLTKRPAKMKEFFEWLFSKAANYPARDRRTVPYDDERINILVMEALNRYKIGVDVMRKWPLNNVWLGVTTENQARADERIPVLLQIPADVRFVSVEPMLEPVNLSKWIYCYVCANNGEHFNPVYGKIEECPVCDGDRPILDWVICGGETGPGARPMHPDWVRNLRDLCQAAGVPFFFKHWGEWKAAHRQSDVVDLSSLKDNQCVMKAQNGGHYLLTRTSRKRTGRQLDGREWNEMPDRVSGKTTTFR